MALPVQSAGFSDALVILGAAGLVIPLFARLRVNPVIGFILVGVLAGPAGLGRFTGRAPWLFYFTITDPHGVEPFAEFGIILLLFSIGLELSFARLWAMRGSLFGLGPAELLLSAAVLAGGALATGAPMPEAIGLGLALALSSTALILPIAGTDGLVGRLAFSMLLFEDLALVPIVFVLGALGSHGGGGTALVVLAKGVATVTAMLVGGRVLLPKLFAQAARAKNPELFLAAGLLVVILAAIATTSAGLSPIVGALVAGILIAETDYRAEVEVLIAPFQGLALGVFLITIGMRLDLHRIAGEWRAVALGTAAVIGVKAVVTGGLLRFARLPTRTAVHTGLLMAAPSETTLIVLGTAVGAGIVRQGAAAFWETCAAIGLAVTPFLALLGDAAGRAVGRAVGRGEREDEVPAPVEGPHTVVIGYGRVGRLVADMLVRHGRAFRVIDADVDAVARGREAGVPIQFGDVSRRGMLDKLDLGSAEALVLTMDDAVQLVRTTRDVRKRHPHLPILSRAREVGHAAELYRAGASEAVPETLEASLQLSGAVLVELGIAMGPVIASLHERRAELRRALLADGGGQRHRHEGQSPN